MNATNPQLKQALAKMLPEKLIINQEYLCWNKQPFMPVLDTELLHLC